MRNSFHPFFLMPCSHRSLPYTKEMKKPRIAPKTRMKVSSIPTPVSSPFAKTIHPCLTLSKINLCGSDSLAETSTTLSRAEMGIAADNLVRLLYNLVALGQDKLDVARVRHVRVDLCQSC